MQSAPTPHPSAAIDWDQLDALKYVDEDAAVAALLADAPLDAAGRASVAAEARNLVVRARGLKRRKGVMESFLEEFGLSNAEGLALMCLAEALLRVPDEQTADKLIAEKISTGQWAEHLGKSDHWLVNAGTFGLMMTGHVVNLPQELKGEASEVVGKLTKRMGEPVVRAGAMQAMRILGEQFVLGRNINAALKRGASMVRAGGATRYSFDMLGEGARTNEDAVRYLAAYANAIDAVGEDARNKGPHASNGISVKLSALHPRYETRQEERVMHELYPRVLQLAEQAKKYNIGLTMDAEEADRLVMSMHLFERLALEPSLKGWEGLGLAIQAYQKRTRALIEFLTQLARKRGTTIQTRLVKGAYWDGEVKRAQIQGRVDFPVWTTKAATDVHYLACARDLFRAGGAIFPQFATHNAHTVAAVRRMGASAGRDQFEFQRLHGMGEALYAALEHPVPVRVYAPVGGHEDLLPYLVRRLLENGANTSFVHSFLDDDVSPDVVAADPMATLEANPHRHRRLPPPPQLFGASRKNSTGRDLSVEADREALRKPKQKLSESGTSVAVDVAVTTALKAHKEWDARGGAERGAILRAMADALQANHDPLCALIAREAGRSLQDGIDEVREAIDFCRYYAAEAERLLAGPIALPSPAGETDHLELHGRGVFVCISPWNFPLAIFTGQLAAALAAGNAVIAKPAEQTPRIAEAAVNLFYEAGLPRDVLQLVQGDGKVGGELVGDPRIAGVAFTGSTEVARIINRTLAAKDGPIVPLIAETGGLNGMFIDTTALKEQVVDDVIASAFQSAGQRCSSLRVLFLPNDTADGILETLLGAMDTLVIGDPADPFTDIGPIIDAEAKANLDKHIAKMRTEAKVLKQLDVSKLGGNFFGPAVIELKSLDQIDKEVFGPILHVVRYDPSDIANVGAKLAAKGYGLTLGVHSRLESFADDVKKAVPAGNVYVNRTIVGAVVGVQPFGGSGLSGTGPKAGGPFYLPRFAEERAISVNIAAQGGDPHLLNL
ncbi:L-glutamate gamma-semialdehyde dehydrogenase [Terricaulis silvestris]|uniref:Bifunctional protein PutA n=1 Tax=Terricaulis silvestris TaxID=2686094 RepID=A0A6I6MP19_9CAUL|nr:L-glutamate gamma-semialdehyde dehydrogenase [Terricaulis silvestris]QGZ96449.1 Bifunctional protein PutA [Terricaulis silvestris]